MVISGQCRHLDTCWPIGKFMNSKGMEQGEIHDQNHFRPAQVRGAVIRCQAPRRTKIARHGD